MYFYIDESGHTGANLFDPDQPILYYGVLSSRVNLDILIEKPLASYRQLFGVARLHASELGIGRLVTASSTIVSLIKKFDIRFDVYRIAKPDHAIICFFDQVFDQGVNPAVTWTGYWTPLRYVLLLKVASLFDEELARHAWEARITPNADIALPIMKMVCIELRSRLSNLPDQRSRQLIGDSLLWAEANPKEILYNVPDNKAMLQITPNVVGFQSVMHGIAHRIGSRGVEASKILVDQQSQFNQAQKTLSQYYQAARGFKASMGPGMPVLDHRNVPAVPIEFSSSFKSAGLEFTDLLLWIYKKALQKADLPFEIWSIVNSNIRRGRTDEISLNAIAIRWTKYFDAIPELHEMPVEQVERGQEILRVDEERRLKAVQQMVQKRSTDGT